MLVCRRDHERRGGARQQRVDKDKIHSLLGGRLAKPVEGAQRDDRHAKGFEDDDGDRRRGCAERRERLARADEAEAAYHVDEWLEGAREELDRVADERWEVWPEAHAIDCTEEDGHHERIAHQLAEHTEHRALERGGARRRGGAAAASCSLPSVAARSSFSSRSSPFSSAGAAFLGRTTRVAPLTASLACERGGGGGGLPLLCRKA